MWDRIDDAAPANLVHDILENEIDEYVEDQIEMEKRCLMPYDRLNIRCNRKEIDFEKIDYLLDEKEGGVASASGTS